MWWWRWLRTWQYNGYTFIKLTSGKSEQRYKKKETSSTSKDTEYLQWSFGGGQWLLGRILSYSFCSLTWTNFYFWILEKYFQFLTLVVSINKIKYVSLSRLRNDLSILLFFFLIYVRTSLNQVLLPLIRTVVPFLVLASQRNYRNSCLLYTSPSPRD